MLDKNLFLYDLAIVAIFKDEGRYLKEWLDYHLLAGVEHFYLYNNESSDDYAEILAPYVEKNLVTLIDFPGKVMQMSAYNDALEKFRFECRYMAFIDLDEFIFPKTNQSIVEFLDEILSGIPNAAGLAINWQIFGSNGHEKADYSRGVLERFTRRAQRDYYINRLVKTIVNPRRTDCLRDPHSAIYFTTFQAVNENGVLGKEFFYDPVTNDKIVVNHYFTKSHEEYISKRNRGRSDSKKKWPDDFFDKYNNNEEFDDGILNYRAARAEKFSSESNDAKINRVETVLVNSLTQNSPVDIETLLACRALAEKFQIKIGEHSAEENALALIYRTLTEPMTIVESQMFLKVLPQILVRPFPICKEILQRTQDDVIPRLYEDLKSFDIAPSLGDAMRRSNLLYLQKFLRLIKL